MATFRPTYRDPKTGEQRHSKVWWYEFTIAGKRVRESAMTTRKTIASEAEKRRRLELEKSLAGMPVEQRENRIRCVSDVIKAYLAHYRLGHRPKSILFAENRLAHVERLMGSTLLPDVNETAVRSYMSERLDEEASGRSINAELGELSRAIGRTWKVLWPKVRKLEERHDVGRALSPEEEARLLEAAGKQKRSPMIGTFLRVALLTGMRYGEIAGLQWGRIDLERRLLTVGNAKTAAGEGRVIPLGKDLLAILEMHLEWFRSRFGDPKPEHYLFPFGSPWPTDPTKPTTTVKTVWGKLRTAANVECRLHDLRHTAATKMAEAGVPESTMLALMGHMSRKMLERYSHIRLAAKREAVESMRLSVAVSSPQSEAIPTEVPKESPKVSRRTRLN